MTTHDLNTEVQRMARELRVSENAIWGAPIALLNAIWRAMKRKVADQ